MAEDKEDIVAGNLGEKVTYDLDFLDNKLVFNVRYTGPGVGGGVSLNIDPNELLDKLAVIIPGQVDDAIIAALKAAFLA